ncbi:MULTISPECIES: hypothetical protein [Nocardia]|uniref:hypothetical protein n=1 Tax=Nocardia TaxID=1817 RepID=UPI00265B719C|nr:hypothetical protein [Nocardia sp. PE-7]WKG08793.1 hypothetical protein QX204_27735 [Nocardia sp. PE-7]
MTPTPPPEWTAATLATVGRQRRDVTTFGAVASADQINDVLARIDAHMQRQFRVDGLNAANRPLKPPSPMGCQSYRQAPR